YLGIADVWFHDFDTGASMARSVPVPLARGVALPDVVGGAPIRFAARGLELSMVEVDDGTRLRVAVDGPEPFEADVLVRRPEGHESLGVVIPWGERRYQYTNKDVARPAEGVVTWGDRRYELAADGRSWGCLDFGRGRWPYRTRWNWGAGAGVVEGPDGRRTKVAEDLVWAYATSDWLRPRRVRTPRSDQVDLTFPPIRDKRSRLSLGVLSQAVDQCFGTWSGTIVPDGGEPLAVDGLFGWAEEATWRW